MVAGAQKKCWRAGGEGDFTNIFLFSLSHSWKKLRQPAPNRLGTRAANTKTCPYTQENYLLVGSSSQFSGLGEFTVLLACVLVALNGTFRRFFSPPLAFSARPCDRDRTSAARYPWELELHCLLGAQSLFVSAVVL